VKYLDNITKVPLQSWWDIQDTGNFIYLVKGSDHQGEDRTEKAFKVYQMLNDQVITKYGVSSAFMKILKKKKQYLVMMNDALSTGNRHKEWRAELIKKDIENMSNKESTGKREDSLVVIHKELGGVMPNPREMTVDQFHYNMSFVNRSLIAQKKLITNG